MGRSDEMISGLSFAGNINSLFTAKTASTASKSSTSFSDYLNGTKNAYAKSSAVTKNNSTAAEKYTKVFKSIAADQKVKKAERTSDESASKKVASKGTKDTKVSEKMQKVTTKIKEVSKKQLGLSEEELEKVMETLALTMADLLNADKLKEMLLYANGNSDVMDLLTNESLNTSLNELLEEVSMIMEMAEVTPEQIMEFETSVVFDKKTDVTENAEEMEVLHAVKEESPESMQENEIAFSVIREEKHSDAAASNDSFKQQSNTGSEMANQFLDHMIGNVTATQTEALEEVNAFHELKEIARQIIDEIKVAIKPGSTSMELDLNPDHLGKVRLNIESHAGGLTAKFTAESEAARQAIETSIQALREALENQGIKVDKIEVLVSDFSFAGSNQQGEENGQSSRGRSRTFRTDEELTADLTMDASQTEETVQTMNGTSIDYSA
ncbi:MAG: flagellar hook-length control protein FliK [Lachnospiraceae bacterium]|nr:flagellar hook-length control protein FliK [Lachnospiraceae bacterium]